MKAIWRGTVLADSENTLKVGGYVYFPRDTVRMDLLAPSLQTPRDLECPHGVRFFDVAVAAQRSPRAAWSYEAPLERMKPVDHWIGFWEDVEVV